MGEKWPHQLVLRNQTIWAKRKFPIGYWRPIFTYGMLFQLYKCSKNVHKIVHKKFGYCFNKCIYVSRPTRVRPLEKLFANLMFMELSRRIPSLQTTIASLTGLQNKRKLDTHFIRHFLRSSSAAGLGPKATEFHQLGMPARLIQKTECFTELS